MVKFDANIDTVLLKMKTPSTSNITFLRFIPENNIANSFHKKSLALGVNTMSSIISLIGVK